MLQFGGAFDYGGGYCDRGDTIIIRGHGRNLGVWQKTLVAVKISTSFSKHHDDYGGHLITLGGSLMCV